MRTAPNLETRIRDMLGRVGPCTHGQLKWYVCSGRKRDEVMPTLERLIEAGVVTRRVTGGVLHPANPFGSFTLYEVVKSDGTQEPATDD